MLNLFLDPGVKHLSSGVGNPHHTAVYAGRVAPPLPKKEQMVGRSFLAATTRRSRCTVTD